MKPSQSKQRGVLLLEALVAILLIAFGILGLVALWAVSIRSVSEAKYRTDASFLANEIVGQMWMDRANVVTGYTAPTNWTNRVAAALPNGVGSVTVAADPNVPTQLRATILITWLVPGDLQTHNFSSAASINGAGPI